MIHKLRTYLRMLQAMQRVQIALSRASAVQASRNLDWTRPHSWEFSGFSQNGEDGIIEALCSHLKQANRYFIEIGSADGIENNTAMLAIAHKYCGLMIEGDQGLSAFSAQVMARVNLGVQCVSQYIDKDNAKQILAQSQYHNPDVFSIDIDGNDYYVFKALLEEGLRPKICVVEYNSAFGPEQALTVAYSQQDFLKAHPSGLYYGVSIRAWQSMLAAYGYHFIGVESRGVNGFFVDPQYFDAEFLKQIKPSYFEENFFQKQTFHQNWSEQFKRIQDLDYEVIE